MSTTVGFVGLGLMGHAMASRLIRQGTSLIVTNRTREKATSLLAAGARWAGNPAEVAQKADVVFSMISTPEVLEEIAAGSGGILGGIREGAVHVDCSTVSPALTRRLSSLYESQGRSFVHCPVLGSVPQATEGKLLLMAGGKQEALAHIEPLLQSFGTEIWKFPRAEDASHMKLLCNLFIAGAITTLCQALVFAEQASVSPQTLLEIISHSALNSSTYQAKGKSILEGNFAARFFTEHMLKDVRLMIEAASEKGVRLPTVEVAEKLLAAAVENGYAKEDYSSIIKILRAS